MNQELLELAKIAKKHFANGKKTTIEKQPTRKKRVKSKPFTIAHHTSIDTLPQKGAIKNGKIYIGRNLRRRKHENYWTEIWITPENKKRRQDKAKELRLGPQNVILKNIIEIIKNIKDGETYDIPSDQDLRIWKKAVTLFSQKKGTIIWSLKKLIN